ncbi:MAG: apolipoprotein N-acyltransferase [Bacteroidetes bacterium]|nr:apolipoprotein N-acyltransferase [Bacteroidota bacterium]
MKILNNPFVLGLFSGLLLFLGWPSLSLPLLLFVAFVPLLFAEEKTQGRHTRFFFVVFSSMMLWNLLCTYWVWYASPGGCIAMLLVNTMLMSFVWMSFRMTRRFLGKRVALIALPVFWLGFEYLHSHWQLAFPWLHLGHGLAYATSLIQWYEFTGVSGGTLWIWVINLFIFLALNSSKRTLRRTWLPLGLLFLTPMKFSDFLLKKERNKLADSGPGVEVLVLQPNFDPYGEKFNTESVDLLEKMLDSAEAALTPDTRILLLPETALVGPLDEDGMESDEEIRLCRGFLQKHPQLAIVSGAFTRRLYHESKAPTHTARATSSPEYWVDYFNAGIWLDTGKHIGIMHKNKLVPGVERMPYKEYFAFLEQLTIDLGGTSGSLGYDDSIRVLGNPDLRVGLGICYESVFSDWCSGYTRAGAQLLAVATNDGWWHNTSGHKQHLAYGTVRAIENRRWLIRSANTGISAVVDPTGDITAQLGWWKAGSLRAKVMLRKDETFFVRYGDIVGMAASILSVVFLLALLFHRQLRAYLPQ